MVSLHEVEELLKLMKEWNSIKVGDFVKIKLSSGCSQLVGKYGRVIKIDETYTDYFKIPRIPYNDPKIDERIFWVEFAKKVDYGSDVDGLTKKGHGLNFYLSNLELAN